MAENDILVAISNDATYNDVLVESQVEGPLTGKVFSVTSGSLTVNGFEISKPLSFVEDPSFSGIIVFSNAITSISLTNFNTSNITKNNGGGVILRGTMGDACSIQLTECKFTNINTDKEGTIFLNSHCIFNGANVNINDSYFEKCTSQKGGSLYISLEYISITSPFILLLDNVQFTSPKAEEGASLFLRSEEASTSSSTALSFPLSKSFQNANATSVKCVMSGVTFLDSYDVNCEMLRFDLDANLESGSSLTNCIFKHPMESKTESDIFWMGVPFPEASSFPFTSCITTCLNTPIQTSPPTSQNLNRMLTGYSFNSVSDIISDATNLADSINTLVTASLGIGTITLAASAIQSGPIAIDGLSFNISIIGVGCGEGAQADRITTLNCTGTQDSTTDEYLFDFNGVQLSLIKFLYNSTASASTPGLVFVHSRTFLYMKEVAVCVAAQPASSASTEAISRTHNQLNENPSGNDSSQTNNSNTLSNEGDNKCMISAQGPIFCWMCVFKNLPSCERTIISVHDVDCQDPTDYINKLLSCTFTDIERQTPAPLMLIDHSDSPSDFRMTIDSCNFTNCQLGPNVFSGKCIHIEADSSTVVFTRCRFVKCSASCGGAVFAVVRDDISSGCEFSHSTFDQCLALGELNQRPSYHSSAHSSSASSSSNSTELPSLSPATLTEISVTGSLGGAIYITAASIRDPVPFSQFKNLIDSCTFYGNEASLASALHATGVNIRVANSAFRGIDSAVNLIYAELSLVKIENSNITGMDMPQSASNELSSSNNAVIDEEGIQFIHKQDVKSNKSLKTKKAIQKEENVLMKNLSLNMPAFPSYQSNRQLTVYSKLQFNLDEISSELTHNRLTRASNSKNENPLLAKSMRTPNNTIFHQKSKQRENWSKRVASSMLRHLRLSRVTRLSRLTKRALEVHQENEKKQNSFNEERYLLKEEIKGRAKRLFKFLLTSQDNSDSHHSSSPSSSHSISSLTPSSLVPLRTTETRVRPMSNMGLLRFANALVEISNSSLLNSVSDGAVQLIGGSLAFENCTVRNNMMTPGIAADVPLNVKCANSGTISGDRVDFGDFLDEEKTERYAWFFFEDGTCTVTSLTDEEGQASYSSALTAVPLLMDTVPHPALSVTAHSSMHLHATAVLPYRLLCRLECYNNPSNSRLINGVKLDSVDNDEVEYLKATDKLNTIECEVSDEAMQSCSGHFRVSLTNDGTSWSNTDSVWFLFSFDSGKLMDIVLKRAAFFFLAGSAAICLIITSVFLVCHLCHAKDRAAKKKKANENEVELHFVDGELMGYAPGMMMMGMDMEMGADGTFGGDGRSIEMQPLLDNGMMQPGQIVIRPGMMQQPQQQLNQQLPLAVESYPIQSVGVPPSQYGMANPNLSLLGPSHSFSLSPLPVSPISSSSSSSSAIGGFAGNGN
eukprot:MONOS_3726.1-p1 / transcript=MONOS_3726.1 / gene=MONOS_3726 / organism=Monocercomonoides_exilis_PA203 / gene_product=unspecified product / transcript_product=unspecified product / location=Mono_scaffold00090:118824-123488(+) / protein_length=1412 / sequence_SO=supercontig / SO=protein_coding / is_pseudo=false